MDLRTQVLAVDFSLASGAVAVAVLGGVAEEVLPAHIVGIATALLFGCVLYLSEQVAVLAVFDSRRPYSYLVVASAVLGAWTLLVTLLLVASVPLATMLAWLGVGLAIYRLVFGVLAPVPAKRLQQAALLRGLFGADRDREPP